MKVYLGEEYCGQWEYGIVKCRVWGAPHRYGGMLWKGVAYIPSPYSPPGMDWHQYYDALVGVDEQQQYYDTSDLGSAKVGFSVALWGAPEHDMELMRHEVERMVDSVMEVKE